MSTISWEALIRSIDSEMEEPQYVYEFAKDGLAGLRGRRFYDSGPNSGVYVTQPDYLRDVGGDIIDSVSGEGIREVD